MKSQHETDFKDLGKQIQRLRKLKGYTQQDLADKCEVDIRTIQRVEKGELNIGIALLFTIAKVLKPTVAEFFNSLGFYTETDSKK